MAERRKALKPVSEIVLRRVRWVLTNFPTEALSQECDRSLPEYEKFYYRAVLQDWAAIAGGREVSGIRLRFEKGKVVEATAEKNEGYLTEMLAADSGACRLGEFGIGANAGVTEFTRDILLDEKMGGTIHLAVGRSSPESGGGARR